MGLWQKLQTPAFVIIIILAGYGIYYLFSSAFERGVRSGEETPHTEQPVASAAETDLRKLRIPTPDLIAEGKTNYLSNCASCHGASGEGNGPKAAQLNPKPRNFTAEKFQFGDKPLELFNTVTKGVAGTSMPSFMLLSPRVRWSVVHYIRTLIPNPPPDDAEALADIESETGQGAGEVDKQVETAKQGPRIPIKLAMQKLAIKQMDKNIGEPGVDNAPGAGLYRKYCASCHGDYGQGNIAMAPISTNPPAFSTARSLSSGKISWLDNKRDFRKLLFGSGPTRHNPGFADLTGAQADSLYQFIKALQSDK